MQKPFEEARPKPYHHGDLRNALIEAGIELLAEGGAAALDLRKVARRAGVSHAAPYRHFADKQALVAAIDERGFGLLAERIRLGLEAAPSDTAARLTAIARAYVGFAHDRPWLMREMFSGLTVERETLPDLMAASKDVYYQYAEVIRAGQRRGEIIDGEPAALASVLWSLLHGVAMLTIEGQMSPYVATPEALDRAIEYSIDLLIHGLGRR